MNSDDRNFIQIAINLAKNCKSEPGRVSPKVGVVVVKDGRILAECYRGQKDPGDHAEFTALEKELADEIIAGATIYTTLEPCTTRKHPKISCAERLRERKVARVVVGMLDPNEKICGRGIGLLREANIETELFPPDLAAQVEEQNRDFKRYITSEEKILHLLPANIEKFRGRPLDEWYKAINYIYLDRNYYRDTASIFAHLVEAIGGLSPLASGKTKPGPLPETYLPKALAWWFALCGKVGVVSVQKLLWLKFPGVCPYCQSKDHDPKTCKMKKVANPTPNWDELRRLGERNESPKSLAEWQGMFGNIYKPNFKADFESVFARLGEELGELAEAVRTFQAAPGYFLSEAADVFAWLMNIQNNLDYKKLEEGNAIVFGAALERLMATAYPDFCTDCGKQRCICQPILKKTIGRIAKDIPSVEGQFDVRSMFMRPEEARNAFAPEA